MSASHQHQEKKTLSGKIEKEVNVSPAKCYQCGKCSAGCPVAEEMDYPPSVIMRMLQSGFPEMEQKVLGSKSIWLCVTCEMCYSRCPMEIDIPKVMDFLRQKAYEEHKAHPKSKDIVAFHEAFLNSIRKYGRLHEVGMVSEYKMKTFHLMQDVNVAPTMYAKGKLHLFPEKIKELKIMKQIFSKTLKKGGQ